MGWIGFAIILLPIVVAFAHCWFGESSNYDHYNE